MREVLPEQVARARHLDSKAGTTAGFCATALALNLALGTSLLKRDLGSCGGTLIHVFFGLAVLALAAAALAAVFGGLRPMGFKDLDNDQIDAYSDRPKVVTAPVELRMTWLRTMTEMAMSARKAGDDKAKWSRRATTLLSLGVVGVIGQASTLLLAS
jgi:hypothetical protein